MWRAHWSTGEAGQYAGKSGLATRRAAQQYADEWEASARLWPGLRVEPGLSVGEWWLRWFPAQDLAPATLETYAQQYRRYVPPCFVERTLAEITGLDLVGFARGLRGHGLAPSRVTVVLSVIRDLLADAANRRGQPIRNSDFLRRWRPACDGAAERLARDGHRAAVPGAALPRRAPQSRDLLTGLGSALRPIAEASRRRWNMGSLALPTGARTALITGPYSHLNPAPATPSPSATQKSKASDST